MQRTSRRNRRFRRLRREDGYVLALTALLMIPLALVTGFAVDLGSFYGHASQVQRAADAAALAGVTELPDVNGADILAKATAAKNGFTHGQNGVTIVTTPIGENKLKVVINDPNVSQYFSKIGGRDAQYIERQAVGQYVLPIPMGSPNNYLGTKDMFNVGGDDERNENFWLAVSGRCVSRSQGERLTTDDESTRDACTGGSRIDNPEFDTATRAAGYYYVMEVPQDYSGTIDLQVYDGPLCGSYTTDRNGNRTANAWNLTGRPSTNGNDTQEEAVSSGTGSESVTQYTFTVRSNDSFNPANATVLQTHNLRGGSISTGAGSGSNRCGAQVDTSGTNVGGVNRFQCRNDISGTANLSAGASNSSMNWASCWHTLHRFVNPTKGLYYVQVQAPTAGIETNQFALRAKTGGVAGNTFTRCSSDPLDATFQANCPQVYAATYMGVYAIIEGEAPLYLAEVGSAHLGKYLRVELWDTGEGASTIELLNPSGDPVTFDVEFRCNDGSSPSPDCTNPQAQAAPDGGWGPYQVDSLDVSGTGTQPWAYRVGNSKFNDRLMSLTVKIGDNDGDGVIDEDDENPFGGETWWKIKYTTASAPTDRTTWAVSVIGSPVRLTPDS